MLAEPTAGPACESETAAFGASLSCQLIAAKVGNQHPILPFENRE
jgi:hypothetical protein